MPRDTLISDQTVKKLIAEVQKRECLWNPHNDLYNDRYQMAKAWLEIAELLQLPEERLRVKWKYLRDLFKKEVKKSGSGADYTGKWRHFERMQFIDITKVNGESEDRESTNISRVTTKKEVDDEFEYEVEEEEPVGTNEVEVYLEEGYSGDHIPEKRAKLSSDEDYDVMFLKSLAPFFRQLEPMRKLVVRSKMQDMLLNEMAAQSSASHLHNNKS
ncbi:transcription factor Adf-1-like [Helicoverpa zea]|uniref:transcription factor Adf-1-like n=1 Tax=Helicoverpa zea TaxID=7113 RepID=UPI001F5667B3|nr:transcription factor Adf-1-like [Helicoverpa zea]